MKGFLFIPEMAVATLRDVDPKTQTRRVIVPQPEAGGIVRRLVNDYFSRQLKGENRWEDIRPDYRIGERRCLLTTWAVPSLFDHKKPIELPTGLIGNKLWHAGMGHKPKWAGKSRPGRFLPNSLRPFMPVLEVAAVRAERVQDISEQDAIAEGVERIDDRFWHAYFPAGKKNGLRNCASARESFRTLWDSINAERGFGWSVNPWVWAVGFRRVTP